MQGLSNDHLTLRLMRLKRADEWREPCEGLVFVLPKAGRVQYSIRSNTTNLLPGDVLIFDPADGGKLVGQDAGGVFWRFCLSFEHLLPLFSAREIYLLQAVSGNFKHSKHYAASTLLAQKCHRMADGAPPAGDFEHRGQTLGIAAAVLSAEFLNARKERIGFLRGEDHVMEVFERLSAEDLLTLSVDDLAAKFSCSRRHLSRLFHQHFGYSVAALRMEMRMLKAVALLRDPAAKVINVAEDCGFNHLGLFNTCFKRRFGVSPGRWRKSGEGVKLTSKTAKDAEPESSEAGYEAESPNGGSKAEAIREKVYQILGKNTGRGTANGSLFGLSAQKSASNGVEHRNRPSL